MIAIVDYGLGNIRAFVNVYTKLNIPVVIARTANELESADKIILPGVGSFDQAIELLERSGMRPLLEERVLQSRVPVLGICVGMQMLANSSQEGKRRGLGWIDGEVKKFTFNENGTIRRTPHMGWNTVNSERHTDLLKNMDLSSTFYFLHSYYFECRNVNDVVGFTDYYGNFASVVASGNVYGVQFHPEKSHRWGTLLLENFARLN